MNTYLVSGISLIYVSEKDIKVIPFRQSCFWGVWAAAVNTIRKVR